MIKSTNTDNTKKKAFSLIEMIIVLIVMGILLMMGVWMSGSQVQKIQNKSVKESILSEWQSRYSRNLWSSSFAWMHYDSMEVEINQWSNEIRFSYSWENIEWIENIFTDRFVIQNISEDMKSITLKYKPYQISCSRWNNSEWGEPQEHLKLQFTARVNSSQDYCFEIDSKNCRLMEIKCEDSD